MKRISQTLAAALHPESYPAPVGRGPDGWPLVPCAVCGRAIPWPVHSRCGAPLPPAYYYRRRFCSRPCDQRGAAIKGRPDGRDGIVARVLEWRDRWRVPLPETPAFAATFPQSDAITRCRRCRGTALRDIAVGKQCVYCGQIMYARDGDWQREARVGSVARR